MAIASTGLDLMLLKGGSVAYHDLRLGFLIQYTDMFCWLISISEFSVKCEWVCTFVCALWWTVPCLLVSSFLLALCRISSTEKWWISWQEGKCGTTLKHPKIFSNKFGQALVAQVVTALGCQSVNQLQAPTLSNWPLTLQGHWNLPLTSKVALCKEMYSTLLWCNVWQ